MYYLAPINGPSDWMWWNPAYGITNAPWQILIRLGLDVTVMVVGGAIFALFWIKTAGLDSKDVARQIQLSGMSIPGYRRNPQVLEKYLDRYIPRVTVIGGGFIGVLSVFANLFGVIGSEWNGASPDCEYHLPTLRGDCQPADHGDVSVHADILGRRYEREELIVTVFQGLVRPLLSRGH